VALAAAVGRDNLCLRSCVRIYISVSTC